MSRVRKLILGHGIVNHKPSNALKAQVYIVLRIWRNYSHHDFGIERFIRLFLACAQFLSLSLYLKHVLGSFNSTTRKIAIEIYVLFKMIFPLLLLSFGWKEYYWTLPVIVYFLVETVLYVTSLIFISDVVRENVQPRRSLALLFINFFELVFDFAFIYAFYDTRLAEFFTRDLHGGIDAIYFSFVTAATVGYGDIAPKASLAEKLAIGQLTVTFIFVGLFLNYFANLLNRVNQVNTSNDYKKMRHTKKTQNP
jgi:hypothetical protein